MDTSELNDCLLSAGCTEEVCHSICHLDESGHADEALVVLAAQRLKALVAVRETNECLACIDQAIRLVSEHALKKERKVEK